MLRSIAERSRRGQRAVGRSAEVQQGDGRCRRAVLHGQPERSAGACPRRTRRRQLKQLTPRPPWAARCYSRTSSGLPVNETLRVAFSPATRTTTSRLRGSSIFDPFARRIESRRRLLFHVILTRINSPLRKLKDTPS